MGEKGDITSEILICDLSVIFLLDAVTTLRCRRGILSIGCIQKASSILTLKEKRK